MTFRSRPGSIFDEALGIGGEHLDGLGNRGANISDAKNQSGQDVAQVGGGVAAIGLGPGSSNQWIDRGKRDLSLFVKPQFGCCARDSHIDCSTFWTKDRS